MKESLFRRSFVQAWDFVCIHPLPAALRAGAGAPAPQYALPLAPWLGALAMLAALPAAELLEALFVPRAAMLIFAALALFVSEWRTSGRGLTLLVSTLDGRFSGKSQAAARAERTAHFRALSGLAPLLMVILIAVGKSAAFALAFRDGCPWFAGAALTAAFTVESFLAASPSRSGDRTEAAVFVSGGFLLLWSFAFRALPTLAGAALAAAAVWFAVPAARSRAERPDRADMTLAGYLGELMMLLALLVFL